MVFDRALCVLGQDKASLDAQEEFRSAGCKSLPVHAGRRLVQYFLNLPDIEFFRLREQNYRLLFDERMISNIEHQCSVCDVVAHAGDIHAIGATIGIRISQHDPEVPNWIARRRNKEGVPWLQKDVSSLLSELLTLCEHARLPGGFAGWPLFGLGFYSHGGECPNN